VGVRPPWCGIATEVKSPLALGTLSYAASPGEEHSGILAVHFPFEHERKAAVVAVAKGPGALLDQQIAATYRRKVIRPDKQSAPTVEIAE
jgi:hypothetical protein